MANEIQGIPSHKRGAMYRHVFSVLPKRLKKNKHYLIGDLLHLRRSVQVFPPAKILYC